MKVSPDSCLPSKADSDNLLVSAIARVRTANPTLPVVPVPHATRLTNGEMAVAGAALFVAVSCAADARFGTDSETTPSTVLRQHLLTLSADELYDCIASLAEALDGISRFGPMLITAMMHRFPDRYKKEFGDSAMEELRIVAERIQSVGKSHLN